MVEPLLIVNPKIQTKIQDFSFGPGVNVAKVWHPVDCDTLGLRTEVYARVSMRVIGSSPAPLFAVVMQPRTNVALAAVGDIVTSTASNIVVNDVQAAQFVYDNTGEDYRGIPVPMNEESSYSLWVLSVAGSVTQRWRVSFRYFPVDVGS